MLCQMLRANKAGLDGVELLSFLPRATHLRELRILVEQWLKFCHIPVRSSVSTFF